MPEPIELSALLPDPIELLVVKPEPIELSVLLPDPIELLVVKADRTVVGSITPPTRGCVPRTSTLLPVLSEVVGKEMVAPATMISPELTRAWETNPAIYTGVAPAT